MVESANGHQWTKVPYSARKARTTSEHRRRVGVTLSLSSLDFARDDPEPAEGSAGSDMLAPGHPPYASTNAAHVFR